MNRKEKILDFIINHHNDYPQGFTTEILASSLDLLRPNVSSDLNTLVKDGHLDKTLTRPVNYFLATSSDNKCPIFNQNDPFRYLIGHDSSLNKQVNQAKSAVIYPPHGLHTLITGDTGVGKSLFANLMFNYALHQQKLHRDAPFIVFNCADYASNPQLLVSHIFGHLKGAYTGADREKLGLLQEANGGMLFLDEVHRLPPEGQEMIFYFMDTGNYGLLGETQRQRRAEILLVCATTEDPDSFMLATFLRRIPITINLPNLAQRSPEDQVALLRFLLTLEAQKIGCDINVDADSARAMIGSAYSGNVGKLKSIIQSVCAEAFYQQQQQNQPLNIIFGTLAPLIKTGIFTLQRDTAYATRLQRALAEKISVIADCACRALPNFDSQHQTLPFDVYSVIDSKIDFMLEQNFSDSDINHFITREINHFLALKQPRSLNHFDHGIDSNIMAFCYSLKILLELQSGKNFSDGFIVSLGFHLDNVLQHKNTPHSNNWTKHYRVNQWDEYQLALTIKDRLLQEFSFTINDDEVAYLTILLASLVVHERQQPIQVIVAAHGSHIASNMADIARTLIAEDNIAAVDMPLDIRPNHAIEQIRSTIQACTDARGILLLVDMGSLLQAGDIIAQQCNIAIRTLPMVSTPLVIEALRRSALLNAELDDIYYSLQHFKGYSADPAPQLPEVQRPQAVLAICSSGKGIAQKLQQFLSAVLEEMKRQDIHILSMSVDEMQSRKTQLSSEYQLLLAVGVMDPQLDIPFIPLADFFSARGELLFQTVIGGSYPRAATADNPVTLTKLAEQYLQEFLVFLNPRKVVPIVMSFLHSLKELRGYHKFGNGLLNICVHTCMALERSVRNEDISYSKQNRERYLASHIFSQYQNANQQLEMKIGVRLSDDELLYLVEMLEPQQADFMSNS